jgi:hypothetical protein
VSTSGRRIQWVVRVLIVVAGTWRMAGVPVFAQDALIERPGPPALDDLETDEDKDRVPDGWYNARDAVLQAEGGVIGPHFVRFQSTRTGRPSRISRAFGIDGRQTEAIILGLWVRPNNIQHGERDGAEPCLLIDFLGDELRIESHSVMGPWKWSSGNAWTRMVKRMAVPPGTKDAILTVGLMGATGTLDLDGLTVELVPVGGEETTNLIVNGGFELGDPAPDYWVLQKGAHRIFSGNGSPAALELSHAGSRAMVGVAIPIDHFEALDVSMAVRCAGLRGADGAGASLFFLDEFGKPVQGQQGVNPIRQWSGSFPWRLDQTRVAVPPGATRAMLQFDKRDAIGTLRIDDVRITALPEAQAGSWIPFHEADATDEWLPVAPSPRIAPDSALDVSFLMPDSAARGRFITAKEGHLVYNKGGRARFLGVSLLPPTAFVEPERADALADRLACSGINLVRLGDLDTALGPQRSLIDDTFDDTQHLDPVALARFDHLVAALKNRGISVALELHGARLFRAGDGIAEPGLLPPGSGPAYQLDPTIRKLALAMARALLDHVNPETGLALRDDPVLAWVTLSGEQSLFNLIDRPDSLTGPYAAILRTLAEKAPGGLAGRRLWEGVEGERSRQMADALRKDNLRVPIAGVSSQRREREFVQAQAAPGLDVIDDRAFWFTRHSWAAPDLRTMIWSDDGGILGMAVAKRRPDRPYVVSQWCNVSLGAWSLPTEAADMLLGVQTAAIEDWDALVRRGVFLYPVTWGANATGTGGGEDIFPIAEVVNGSPHIYALSPHAASLFFRSEAARSERERASSNGPGRRAPRGGRRSIPGWDPAHGRLVIDTPYTQALAGWVSRAPANLEHLDFSAENDFAVLAATSIGPEPIASTKRLLVSAIGRVEPTGFRWVHAWRHTVADPGRPPFLQEPVRARLVWRRKGTIRAFELNNAGERVGPATLEVLPDGAGVILLIDGRKSGFHWELIVQ